MTQFSIEPTAFFPAVVAGTIIFAAVVIESHVVRQGLGAEALFGKVSGGEGCIKLLKTKVAVEARGDDQ